MAAAKAFKLNIHTHSQDLPLNTAARMCFFQFNFVVKMKLHENSSCKLGQTLCIGLSIDQRRQRGSQDVIVCRKIDSFFRKAGKPLHLPHFRSCGKQPKPEKSCRAPLPGVMSLIRSMFPWGLSVASFQGTTLWLPGSVAQNEIFLIYQESERKFPLR